MDGRTRVGRIYKAGLEGIEDGLNINVEDLPLIQAMAAMIDYATKKPERKKAETKELLYTETDIMRALPETLTVVQHGRLNKVLSGIKQDEDDVQKFSSWYAGSMQPWMESKEITLTYSMLCRKFADWLEKARKYTATTQTPEAAWR